MDTSASTGIEKAANLQRSGSTIYFASITFTNVVCKIKLKHCTLKELESSCFSHLWTFPQQEYQDTKE